VRRWIIALALSVSLAPAAFAGGVHARMEGPAGDGVTYTVRALSLGANDALDPWASAEGVVDGKPRSVLLRLQPTAERGVYRFTRTWPSEGIWMVRVSLGHPPAPATVAALRADGSVRSNKLFYKTDGIRECYRVLRKAAKLDPDEDC
jgi:hypothetical protein